MPEYPVGTVTFLFTDIEGSTPLWEAHPEEMGPALARHDELVRSAFDRFAGFVFSTGGDGFGVAFHSASDAVGAAVLAQTALQAEPWPSELPIRVRMGIHTGEATRRGQDYFGRTVNRAARVMSSAPGGMVLVSATTTDLLGGAEGLEFVDVGTRHLRGVVEEVRLFAVKAAGLAWYDLPTSEENEPTGNLLPPVEEYVGPTHTLAERAARLRAHRLVTLIGPGGVGKTRTAVEMGLLASEHVNGTWLVDLAEVVDPGGVVPAVAATLGALSQPGMTAVASVVEWCRGRQIIIILDNCEHVLEPVRSLVAAIIAACPQVTILATSREPLGLSAERVIPIEPLNRDDAAELFRSRATAADETVRFSIADIAVIDAICTRLDGIPLAIELAAARARSLSLTDLHRRLDDRFRLLRGGSGPLERHHTLWATVAWSYQLLTPAERTVFARLSVFAGAFDLEAAEQVAGGDEVDPDDVIDLLDSLVAKSMVVVDRSGTSTRFRQLEMLRQFAEERLGESGTAPVTRDRLLAHVQAVAARARTLQNGPRQREGDLLLSAEWPNIRVAFEWALQRDDPAEVQQLLHSCHIFAYDNRLFEHVDWCERVIARWDLDRLDASTFAAVSIGAFVDLDHPHALLRAQQGLERSGPDDAISLCAWMAASVLLTQGIDGATVLLERCEAAAMRSGDPHAIFYALNGWFRLAGFEQAPDRLLETTDRMFTFGSQSGVPMLKALALQMRGSALFVTGAVEASLDAYRHAYQAMGEVQARYWEMMTAASLVSAILAIGSPGALAECAELVSIVHDRRDVAGIAWCADAVANYAARTGDSERAALLLGHLRATAPAWLPMIRMIRGGTEAALAGVTGIERHLEQGAVLTRGEAEDLMFAVLAGG